MSVGFIGLGVMGRSMAGHINAKLGGVVVWNRTAGRADSLAAEGAIRAASPGEVAGKCNVICICVADTPDVEAVVFGPNGIMTGIRPGTLIVDFSTISPAATLVFAARAAERGAAWVDAPLTGGDVGARNATLTIMAGGDPNDIARAKAVFEAVGKKHIHLGPVGSGQRAKLCNQAAVCGTIASMGEAMILARESGLDVAQVLDVIGSGAAGSWTLANYGPRILIGDFDPGFSVRLMAKDLRLVKEAIAEIKGDFSTVERMSAIFEQMVADGEGDLGIHAAVRRLGW